MFKFLFDYIPQSILYILILLFLISLYWYSTIPSTFPPGPPGLPFIGSSLDTWNSETVHIVLKKWVAKYGPVYRIYIGSKLVVVLGDWNAINEALVKQSDIFSGRPRFLGLHPPGIPQNHGVVFSDGEVWKEHRQFAASTLRDLGFGRSILEPRIKEEVEYLIGEVEQTDGKTFDIEKMLQNAVSNVICAMFFGHRYDYKDAKFCNLTHTLKLRVNRSKVGFLSPFMISPLLGKLLSLTPMVKRFQKLGILVMDLFQKEIDEVCSTFHPNQEPNNYIHAFLKMQDKLKQNGDGHSNFTQAQLLEIAVEMFAAGTETVTSTIRWAILYLGHNQDIQEKVYQEIRNAIEDGQLPLLTDKGKLAFTEAVVMETQRIANLIPLSILHRTMADTKLMGYDIPADTLVVPLLTAVLSNPKRYPEPDRFHPNRFLNENGKIMKDQNLIPFSIGKRQCLGESLAKMELFLFLSGLLLKFKFIFPEDQPSPPIKASIGFTNVPCPYNIRAIPRNE